jgi:polar amino acid transport system substrate-binding protein
LPYYTGNGSIVPEHTPGTNILVLRALDEQLSGVTFKYLREPWKRCLSSVETGKVNGVVASYYKSRERIGIYPKKDGKIDLKRKFSTASYCLFKTVMTKLDWNGEKFTVHNDSPVAVPRGYSIIQLLEKHKMNYFEVESSADGFKLLSHGRVNGVVTLCESGRRIIKQNKKHFGHFIEDTPVLVKKSAYLMINREFYQNHTRLVEQMWDGLKDLDPQQFSQ